MLIKPSATIVNSSCLANFFCGIVVAKTGERGTSVP